jgi:SAM-dependent methyltransferase
VSHSHFDDIADRYDGSLPAHVVEHYLRKRTAFVLRFCPPGRGLDVGCGTGVLAERLADNGYEMTGLDPSAGMLDVMRKRTSTVRAVLGSATEMPLDDSSFDLALSVAVMHHIADPGAVRKTLAEMVRVVRPGGAVLIWDHNPRNPYWGSLMARVPQDTGEERLVSEREMVAGLEAAGVHAIQTRSLGFVPDFVPPGALGAAAAIERAAEGVPGLRRYAAHNVILATR